jgi:hypothetical protein
MTPEPNGPYPIARSFVMLGLDPGIPMVEHGACISEMAGI